ncbi:MAG: carboxypeptidase regulatory-like domain-containing protein, partial [Acidobacteriales bacterium]|nr:carboxypeptidase regulatory-like domain-containing protein [Terriglobales bacterium]
LAALLGMIAMLAYHFSQRKPLWIKGAILTQSQDPQKQAPIANVEVTVKSSAGIVQATSDSHGFFTLQLPVSVRRGQPIAIQASHPGYENLDAKDYVTDKLYILQLMPTVESVVPTAHKPATTVDNLRVRYSIKAMTAVNIGSALKIFQVQNTGNVPCKDQHPCSPDGLWKASIGSMSLDAGVGNEFRSARISCIAGPCPFTKIEKDGFSKGGQKISASVRGWSDTTTFLLEAEVFHPTVSDVVHESHPVIFGRALNFTLPAAAEGVSIQADFGGETIIFPLGPALFLSWAKCDANVGPNDTKVYRCELKPDYQFPGTSTEQD